MKSQLYDYWSTSFYEFENENHDDIKQEVLDYLYVYKNNYDSREYDTAPLAKVGKIFETDMRFFHNAEKDVSFQLPIKSIQEFCMSAVREAIIHKNGEIPSEAAVIMLDSWAHITNDGGYHDTHNHANCSWCGIYCIEGGESSRETLNGVNRFHSPLSSNSLDAGTHYLAANAWNWVPQDGHLLVFPSYLMHSALPYEGKIDRVVISFNTTTQGEKYDENLCRNT